MVKPNYRQQKRQKEISRKTRHDEKLQKRTAKGLPGDAQSDVQHAAQDPAAAGNQGAGAPTQSTT